MAEKNNVILPGEFIATEEEYAAGENTFVEGGKILSKTTGKAIFDEINKEVSVKGKNIQQLQEGDIISGRVNIVKESSAMIQLLSAENGKTISGLGVAQLAIRNISNEYVENIKKIIKIGDILRAHVLSANELAIDISTKEKGFGVTNAYCTNCRHEMQYTNPTMTCPECKNTESRKWFEAEDNYVPRSGGFSDRREGGRGGFDRRNGGRDRNSRSFGSQRGGFGGGRREGGYGGGHREGGARGFDNNRSNGRNFGGEGRTYGGNERGFNSFSRRENPRFDSNRGFGRNNYKNNENQTSEF